MKEINSIASVKIGAVLLDNQIVLAPMAGVTDLPFRLLVKEMGCGLVVSEMVSAKGLIYGNENTHSLISIDDRERPIAIQIFGSDSKIMAEAARLIEQAGADMIDINMGCPTQKIVKNGEGSALMRAPELAYEIMAATAAAVKIPVTVKIRSGWDDGSRNAVQIAELAEKAGIAAVAVHGRTREQFYSGLADRRIIKEVKDAVKIPVIGNGDIRSADDAERMLSETGCDAVMVGRGAQGNPWLFREIVHYLKTGEHSAKPDAETRVRMALRHLDMLIAFKGEHIGVREMRSHAAWYTKGMPKSAELRLKFNYAMTKSDFVEILKFYN